MRDEEHKIQAGIIKAVEPIPECRWLHAIPNGGKRSVATGARLKAEGVNPGIADLCLPVPSPMPGHYNEWDNWRYGRNWYHGLYIEVKTPKGRQTKEQKEFEKFSVEQGYKYVIVRSILEGVHEILVYIGFRK
jgi:hypothetical protein